jgi:hypothetical protein
MDAALSFEPSRIVQAAAGGAARHWTAERSRTVRKLRLRNWLLGMAAIGFAGTSGALWHKSVRLQEELADTRSLVQIVWERSAADARPATPNATSPAVGEPFITDTLIEFDRGAVHSAIFTFTGSAGRPLVSCHLRLRNPEQVPVIPRLRILLFDRNGTLIGEAQPSPDLLLPGTARFEDLRIQTKGAAVPNWFAIHWEATADAGVAQGSAERGSPKTPGPSGTDGEGRSGSAS